MAQWNRLINLPDSYHRQIFSIYNSQYLPIEIRMNLAPWIEDQDWLRFAQNNFDLSNPDLSNLITEFGNELNQLCSKTNDIAYRYKLNNYMSGLIDSNHVNLIVRHINDCLNYEREFTRLYREGKLNQSDNNSADELGRLGQSIKDAVFQSENICKTIKDKNEKSNIKKLELSLYESPQNEDSSSQKQRLISEIENLRNESLILERELIQKYKNVFLIMMKMFECLKQELEKWKQRQINKSDSPDNFVQIKEFFELIASNICILWQQLTGILDSLSNEDQIVGGVQEIKMSTIRLFKDLANTSFIVRKQPKQIIKKDTKFDSNVVLLIGSVLNLCMSLPTVEANIINEEQARQWYNDKDRQSRHCSGCGDLVNHTTTMEFSTANNTLKANFVNLRLKSIKRAEKKASIDKVVDEKFALLFRTEIVLDKDTKFEVTTISSPVVVIVHGNQKIDALSTIIWDNSFSCLTRCPFHVPSEVPFENLANVLSKMFYDSAKKHLTEDNIHFLAEKILGQEIDRKNFRQVMIPWTKFSKEPLFDNGPSFWEWFYSIKVLVQEFLKDLWAEDFIMGFLTRQQTEKLLQNKSPGTFLLRFSDSQLGSICISYVLAPNQVSFLNPFCANDLRILKLADRIRDLDQCQFLYPDVSKDDAFGKFYTKLTKNQASNGYIFTQLKNFIPNSNNSNQTNNLNQLLSQQQSALPNSMMTDQFNFFTEFDSPYDEAQMMDYNDSLISNI